MKNNIINSVLLILIISIAISSDNEGLTFMQNSIVNRLSHQFEIRSDIFRPTDEPAPFEEIEKNIEAMDSIDDNNRMWLDFAKEKMNIYPNKDDEMAIWLEPGFWGVANDKDRKDTYFWGRFGSAFQKGMVTMQGVYDVDFGLIDDSTYTGFKWDGKSGSLGQSYIAFSKPEWRFLLGNDYIHWGRGLLFNKNMKTMPMLQYRIDFWDRLRISYMHGKLDRFIFPKPYIDPGVHNTIYIERYLAGHKAELYFDKFSLYFIESVVYGGESRPPEPHYILPITWMHGEQLNSGIDDNTFISAGGKLNLNNFLFEAEFMIDDYQYEKESIGDQEPNELGLSVYGEYADELFGKWINYSVLYEGITNRTYNQRFETNRYLYKNKPIGSQIGNDADIIRIRVDYWYSPFCIFSLTEEFGRQGEGGIYNDWDSPWDTDSSMTYTEPFPTGIIEKRQTTRLDIFGFWNNHLNYNLFFSYSDFKNFNNIKNKKDSNWEIGFDIKYNFHYGYGG
ncbi:MAG: capsule assembly Wzi family protein [Candidatus Zixiibacteriota bacterium]